MPRCPVCDKVLPWGNRRINEHIDACLLNVANNPEGFSTLDMQVEPSPSAPQLQQDKTVSISNESTDDRESPFDEQLDCDLLMLPDEILVKIIGHVVIDSSLIKDVPTGLQMVSLFAQTSRRSAQICQDNPLWGQLCAHRYGKIRHSQRYGQSWKPKSKQLTRLDLFKDVFNSSFLHPTPPPQPNLAGNERESKWTRASDGTWGRKVSPAASAAGNEGEHENSQDKTSSGSIVWLDLYRQKHIQEVNGRKRQEAAAARIRQQQRHDNMWFRVLGRIIRYDLCCDRPEGNSLAVFAWIVVSLPFLSFLLFVARVDELIPITYVETLIPTWIFSFLVSCFIFGVDHDDWTDYFPDSDSLFQLCKRCTAFCGNSFLLLFPLFLALKGDGLVDFSWAEVFIPVHIILFVFTCGLLFVVKVVFEEESMVDKVGLVVLFVTYLGLPTESIIFPIYLDGNLQDTSLFVVLIPVWITGLFLTLLVFNAFLMWRVIVGWAVFVLNPLIVFPLLAALKVEGIITVAWSVTMIPLLVSFGFISFVFCLAFLLEAGDRDAVALILEGED